MNHPVDTPRTEPTRTSKPWPLLVVICAGVLLCVVLAIRSGVEVSSDIRADWIVVAAIEAGLDPHRGLAELSNELGVEFALLEAEGVPTSGRVHPRTPGLLLLLTPLTAVSIEIVFEISLIVNAVATALLLLVICPRLVGKIGPRMPVVAGLAVVGYPIVSAFGYGAHSVVVACLTWGAVHILLVNGDKTPGVLLGLAAIARIFPLALVLPLWVERRRQAIVVMGLTSLFLTMLGMAVFSIDLRPAVSSLSIATEQWGASSGNGSPGVWLRAMGMSTAASSIVLLVGGTVAAVIWVVKTRGDLVLSVGGTLLIVLLASPLSWTHYDVMLIPPAIFLAVKGSKVTSALSMLYLLLWAIATVAAIKGALAVSPITMSLIRGTLGVALVLSAVDLAAARAQSESRADPQR